MNEEICFTLDNPDGTPGEPIKRNPGRPRLTESEKEERRQQGVDVFRFNNRGRIKAEQDANRLATKREGRLRLVWQRNWEALSQGQKDIVEAAHSEAVIIWKMLADCEKNIVENRTDKAPFVDLTFDEVKSFLANQAGSGVFPYVSFAASLDQADFDAQEDENWRLYGRFTTLPTPIWNNFLNLALAFVKQHPEEFSEAFRQELESLVPNHFPTSAGPLPQTGFRQSTKSQESAAQAHKHFVAEQQHIMRQGVFSADNAAE